MRLRLPLSFSALFLIFGGAAEAQGVITTVAGADWIFPTTATSAPNAPIGRVTTVVVDPNQNLAITDPDNFMVFRITQSDHSIHILGGNGSPFLSGDGGPAIDAGIRLPFGLAYDASGNLFVSVRDDNRIRMISPDGVITTVIGGQLGFSGDGGPAAQAQLSAPQGLAIDSAGNLYIADSGNNRIRKVTPSGQINTIVGNGKAGFSGDNGPAIAASISDPAGLALDAAGNLYIADSGNNCIRRISPAGVITTLAGTGAAGYKGDGGPAVSAQLFQPMGVAIDGLGQVLVADYGNDRVRRIDSTGTISTIAGTGSPGYSGDGGPATAASVNLPNTVAIDSGGNIYIADYGNFRVRRIDSAGVISTVVGNGTFRLSADNIPAVTATLNIPTGLAFDGAGNLYVAENQAARVRKITPSGVISTVAGTGVQGFSGENVSAVSASLYSPSRLATDASGNLYITDNALNRVRKVTPNGTIVTIAGTGNPAYSGDGGPATSGSLNQPEGVAVDSLGNVYVADFLNNRIRKIDRNGLLSTVAGNGTQGFSGDGGPATAAALYAPTGVAVDSNGNVYIAERYNNRIRKVAANGVIATLAGNGQAASTGDGGSALQASLNQPGGVQVDAGGNLYIAELIGCKVRKVSLNGTISTVAGTGTAGYTGDGGQASNAELYIPTDVVFDSQGNLYIADAFNDRVRTVLASAPSSSISSTVLSFSAVAGGPPPASQNVILSSKISGLTYNMSADQPWIVLPGPSASIPLPIAVNVDPSTLTPGSYSGTITVTLPDSVPRTSTIAVSLSVGAAPAAPSLQLDSQGLSFTAQQGGAAVTQQLRVLNAGGGTLAFTSQAAVVSGGSWLSVSIASGSATPASPTSITVTADPGSLPPGTYSGSVKVTGGGQTITVPVTFSLSPPTASILLSQSALSFTSVASGGMPLSQGFGVLNSGQGSLSWTATASTLSGGNWLQISPASGVVKTPYLDVSMVQVTTDSSALSAGTYYGRIQVSATAVNSPQLITVILTVLPAGFTLGPQVFPAGLVFTGVAGVTPGSQDVQVGNPAGSANSFQSGVIGSGFTYIPTNAVIQSNLATTVRVYPDFSQVSPGSIQRGTITLQFADGSPPQTISVLLVVAPSGTQPADLNARPRAGGEGRRPEASGSCASQSLLVVFRTPQPSQPTFSATVGQSATLEVQVTDGCGNLVGPAGQSAQVAAYFSDGEPQVTMTHLGSGVWQGAWKPVSVSGAVGIKVTALLQQGGNLVGGVSSGLTGVVTTAAAATTTPLVTAQGVVHAASDQGGVPIAPGGLITVYGGNLSNATGPSSGLPLPQQLNGTQVLLGNQALPILYTSTGQLNVQVPYGVPVNTQYQLTVQRGNTLSVPQQLVVAAAQPGIFTVNQQGTGQGSIVKSDGITLAQPGTAAAIGETVVIYCTGLGAVSPAVTEGQPAPLTPPLSQTMNTVSVTIGGKPAQVTFAGLTPGYAGLYQINVVVPSGITTGSTVPVIVGVAGQTSPAVTMAVQ